MVDNQHGLHIKQSVPIPEGIFFDYLSEIKIMLHIWNKSKHNFAMLRTRVEIRQNKAGLQTCEENQSDGKLTNLFNMRYKSQGLTQQGSLRHPESPFLSVPSVCSSTQQQHKGNLLLLKQTLL